MKHILERTNFAKFLQDLWKEKKIPKIVISKTAWLCACRGLIYLNIDKGKWVLARKFILTQVSSLKIFQVLWIRSFCKSINFDYSGTSQNLITTVLRKILR